VRTDSLTTAPASIVCTDFPRPQITAEVTSVASHGLRSGSHDVDGVCINAPTRGARVNDALAVPRRELLPCPAHVCTAAESLGFYEAGENGPRDVSYHDVLSGDVPGVQTSAVIDPH
jgi:hypothetical protein